MEWPESVLGIAKKAAEKYPDDPQAAADDAVASWQAAGVYEDVVHKLARSMALEMVYDARHKANMRMRRENGQHAAEPKLIVGNSPDVLALYDSLYAYHVAGRTLGMLKGADLAGIADKERRKAAGCTFNAELCARLTELVPEDKLVREAVSEKKLQQLFERVKDDLGGTQPWG